MKKYFYVILLLAASSLLLVVFHPGKGPLVQAQTDSSQGNQYLEPFASIDTKARAAGTDETSVRELVEQIFSTVGGSDLPTVIVDPLKERIVRAEINFRNRRGGEIPEENIVRLVNQLAEGFEAPDYAKTSNEQVRRLRLMNSSLMPHFIIQHPPTADVTETRIGFSVSPTMSPLEAIFITSTLINQKRYNPEFQVIKDETRFEDGRDRQGQKPQQSRLGTINSPQCDEMAAVFNRVTMLRPDDQLRLIADSLTKLGIKE